MYLLAVTLLRIGMPVSPPVITIDHVTKTFPGVTALKDVTLEIAAGEFHAIVGENGAGKSTLMKILSGVITDFDGRLLLRGEPMQFAGTLAAEEAGISIIHQELNLVEQLSAAANIFLGREKRNAWGFLDDRAMERAAAALLSKLECHVSPRQLMGELRVGDQQLVEIAKALSFETEILIMDEPTSALTESEVARLFRIIERLRGRGVTILYISHKMDEVFRFADRITVLRDGQLIKTLARKDVTPREITHLMVGREIEAFDLAGARHPGEVVLEARDLSLPWTGHAREWRLRNINFELRKGEVVGVAGLMGAGRTELLECLFGCSPEAPRGEVLLEGKRVSFQHPSEAKQAGLALVTEDRKRLGLFAQMSVGENLTLCQLSEFTRAGLIDSGRERRTAEETVVRLGVRAAGIDAPITSLSGGNQQKTIIGRWLLTRPKVLLLDDPTRGVDVGAKAELYRLIDQLCREGIAVLVTSSELPELLMICDRILVLCEGRLTGEFARGDFSEHALMEAATRRG